MCTSSWSTARQAKIDQHNADGLRPLHMALMDGHRHTCFMLCALGADRDLSMPEGLPSLFIGDQLLADWIRAVPRWLQLRP